MEKLLKSLLNGLFGLLMLYTGSSIAQTTNLQGTVSGEENKGIPYINVFIKSLNKGTTTNESGAFTIADVASGAYEVTISGIGYEAQIIKVTVPGKKIMVRLQQSQQELTEVVVGGKSETQVAREQSIKAEVINTKALATQPSTMIELMNRAAGVRVRQTGGLGSNASISVNGFQDKAIKYFKDGIPMDYLGAGYNFAFVPVNMLERLEIYKGVLPVSLGADALGGGLNMISKTSFTRHAEVSYEVASFNTHRLSLNGFYRNTTRKYFIGADAFVNYSDNNYSVVAPVTDTLTSTMVRKKMKLFHNRFEQFYAEGYGGFIDTKWADELRIGITAFWIDRQNQYGTSSMLQPFGASTSRQYSIIPTVRYKKTFLNGKLALDQFLVANTIVVEQTDTVKGTYDWYGNFIPSDSRRGEISARGSLSTMEFSVFTSRSNVSYKFDENHKLELNAVYTNLGLVGKDPMGLTFVASGRDVLSVPATYKKFIAAAGLESKFFGQRLTNNFMGKFYQSTTKAVDGDYYGNEIDRGASYSLGGIADAVKFSLSDRSFVRLSAEAATRLPEQGEIFGDGNFHVSNFALKPERSTNFNAGYSISRHERFSLEVNSFYRITRDLILNVPYNFLFNRYENVNNVRGLGFETDASVSILSWLKVNGNFTYQDFRLFDSGNTTYEGARLRNTPYFFANLGLNASRRNIVRSKDHLQAYWYYTFVRQYYLDYIPKNREPDGFLGLWGNAGLDAPNIIPDQHLHTAGLTYFPFDNNFSLGMQVKNIFDRPVYDNFKIQNAGRSFHLKLTYVLK